MIIKILRAYLRLSSACQSSTTHSPRSHFKWTFRSISLNMGLVFSCALLLSVCVYELLIFMDDAQVSTIKYGAIKYFPSLKCTTYTLMYSHRNVKHYRSSETPRREHHSNSWVLKRNETKLLTLGTATATRKAHTTEKNNNVLYENRSSFF